jgi:hypothetical protein
MSDFFFVRDVFAAHHDTRDLRAVARSIKYPREVVVTQSYIILRFRALLSKREHRLVLKEISTMHGYHDHGYVVSDEEECVD